MAASASRDRDELVMATNNSSIISKRSVERTYFPDDPQYYRYFVKKFQRRAPLINRGYHLRMHLIDHVVHQFLSRPSPKNKVIINLGCGSDVLPWQCLCRYRLLCRGVKFVDIDFPDVMTAKMRIVKDTPELHTPLQNLEFPDDPHILLRSNQYCQIACDLRQFPVIDAALATFIQPSDSELLFIAEVSIAYMEPDSADAVIHWASTIGQAEFCLLEQALPDGLSNPFAQTMLQHFEKLGTPLKCISKYPSIEEQKNRFKDLGWSDTQAWTLWQAWSDPLFLSCSDRQKLDDLEVFDEWEEFANFASHYFLLHAKNGNCPPTGFYEQDHEQETALAVEKPSTSNIGMCFSHTGPHKNIGLRRFGAPLVTEDILGQKMLVNFFGIGTESRPRTCDLFSASESESVVPLDLQQGGPTARMCFTLTDIGNSGYLLAGGRTSPSNALSDAWLFDKDSSRWRRTHGLPVPLFRHSVARLCDSRFVLLAGGKSSPSSVFPGFLLYHPRNGWTECAIVGTSRPPPLFGSTLLCTGRVRGRPSSFRGIVSGGMTADGTVNRHAFDWVVNISNIQEPSLTFERPINERAMQLLDRFGATCTQVGDWTVLVGGINHTGSLPQDREIVGYRFLEDGNEMVDYLEHVDFLDQGAPRPVLVGASVIDTGGGEFAIMGGGMTCFSMGTVWSKGVYTCRIDTKTDTGKPTRPEKKWEFSKTMAITNAGPDDSTSLNAQNGPLKNSSTCRVKLESRDDFKRLLQKGQPVVIEGLDLGMCTTKWETSYLAQKVGADRKVVVHESSSKAMDFVSKNFSYATQTFGGFIQDVNEGRKVYLRALSVDKPSDLPARLDLDFTSLSPDFVLPHQLAFAKERIFSSVLRISGPVNMWLHYDVLANVYCQIQGSKRFLLFPPSDVTQLGFSPGASSSSIDVFSSLSSPSLAGCHPQEAIVGPGEVLFLPRLWLHTATPLSTKSVAVNVFFRDLENGYSLGRDVYGNRDLAAYEKARQDLSKIANSFKNIPRDTRIFYLERLADELAQKASE